ncbi:MAG: CDP-alcohol phosphatidyltransferase family protein [Desulfobulbaceae bacterium]|uniref:CDP-diacylglycerol--glycerol-3-phosphate 3-phosphatidyltransferase n=1 Tax=Candidatus Desulfatifera sulfidica TaxID=2841691 RepID=A0A8J6NAP3_9BACT|nr:CDP-alcohol phosphatidyltransferase family protein [Candidatus Desulfatifera sulfidica]
MRYTLLIPNLLSASRFVLAGLLPFSPERLWLWFILASAFSDLLDGYLARRWKSQTWQGGLLDACSDKVFMLVAILTFAAAGKFSYTWIPLLLSRDLTVAAVAAYAACNRSWNSFQNMGSRWPGKLATGAQLLFLACVAACPQLIHLALLLTITLSLIAAIDYGRIFIHTLGQLNKA